MNKYNSNIEYIHKYIFIEVLMKFEHSILFLRNFDSAIERLIKMMKYVGSMDLVVPGTIDEFEAVHSHYETMATNILTEGEYEQTM